MTRRGGGFYGQAPGAVGVAVALLMEARPLPLKFTARTWKA